MKKFSVMVLLCAFAILMGSGGALAKDSKPKKPESTKPCVQCIHVIKGCHACEAMQAWLRAGGIKLQVTSVEQGAYKLFPTVVYSDKTADHGERMYKFEAAIPRKICVISCSVGTK